MASRANDASRDKAIGVLKTNTMAPKAYMQHDQSNKMYSGPSPSGYEAPQSGGRLMASPPDSAKVRAAMRADTGTTRAMPKPAPAIKRYGGNKLPDGNAARRKVIDGAVDKAS